MDGMMEKGGTEPADLSERPQEAGGDKSAGGPPPQRFSAKRKLRAVSQLLRGEPLELVARELDVTAARLSEWRDRALLAAEAALKERTRDDRDDEVTRLKGKVGEMTMETEIAFFGIEASPSFVREPEGNGVAERFIRTLKENLLWVRYFQTIEELRLALIEFVDWYNTHWLVARHRYRTPAQVRADQQPTRDLTA